ncbi:hypothetical protein B4113_2499 [Geobacillus sp. B4113_201601]|nr:hypothetical protein B4113_2499 [Geobacillus sp. B4113_201601]
MTRLSPAEKLVASVLLFTRSPIDEGNHRFFITLPEIW